MNFSRQRTNMKILFFGHDKSSILFLKEIMKNNDLLAIVLPSNRPKIQTEPLIKFACNKKIKTFQPSSPIDIHFMRRIQKLNPDLAIVFNYSHIFKKSMIDIFPQGMINFHGGLLPQYRGANVINWVLINGEKQTGMTVHYIDEKIDNGLIIKRGIIPIKLSDDALSLQKLIIRKGIQLLKQILREVKLNKIKVKTQSYYGQPQYYHRRHPEDGKINFHQGSQEIYNLVRALVEPWPGAFAYYEGKRVIFDQISISKLRNNYKPGQIMINDTSGIRVATSNGSILLKKIRKDKTGSTPRKSFKVGEMFR